MITITVCLIVRNEEKVLVRCLETLKEIADEIILVDTGSTDHTKKLASRYTDKIYDFEWIDDFAAARNFSFSKATMDYIYTADADEVIDEENQKKLLDIKRALLPEIEIVQMKYTNQLQHNTTYNYDIEYRPKLFKRQRNFTWIDPIHETVALQPVIYDSDIEIIHLPESNHADRDFDTFQKIINRGDELSLKLQGMYARELFIAGKDEDFLKAREYFENLTTENHSLEHLKKIQCVLARCARILNEPAELMKHSLKNFATGKSSAEVCYEVGEYYFAKMDYSEAIIWYYNAAYETESELNIRYTGDYPLKRLGECCKRLGKEDEFKEYCKLQKDWLKEYGFSE
ncbi:glycosyl transferase [Anaerocolumna cellulosilytica]|uniref:Glycosyl transferase n=1 Tax=Anaerocolumna cellulosilytica TaxID=433286 RepID=A0A6S6R1T5_9FIRM|nr:glycosyltransferase family 2 protein [Anaerocolumna cellulosilytica]MBB5195696.1 glycosyltransferase involved in cell wall biosynthesis [Anaerocolumna cellulosilytica]BCJ92968.1 glycosyl transferase [Anaerocolumna cellulosilytica]